MAQPWIEYYSAENTSSTIVTSLNSYPIETNFNKTKIERIETIQNKENITNATSVETTLETPPSTRTITETNSQKRGPVSPEIRLICVALIIFLLIHPQVKGFSAGTVKFDLELQSETKGAPMEFELEEEDEGALVEMKAK